MNSKPEIHYSACPHDCPSTCALEVEKLDDFTIGRVRGAADNSYTAGVICAKVARYAERIHHPDRLTQPMRRTGAKGSGSFEAISWDDALDAVAEGFIKAEQKFGSETVWPYFYAGTMGFVMRNGIHRLRHAKNYSGMHATICTALSFTGYVVGTGKLAGSDPREMAETDLLVIWGTNPVHTQVNVMTHAINGRKQRGGKIVVVDIYETATMKQADMGVIVRPGTDGALACAIMHILFRDNLADRDFLAQYTDCPAELEAHLKSRDPQWASAITGVPVAEIEALARLIGDTPKTYFRLGYGFTRGRNGAANMHAVTSIASVAGSWQHHGGGAFHNNGDIYTWNLEMIEGQDVRDPNIRALDQTRIGPVLTGDSDALRGGPPVTAMLIQNTNPVTIAPEYHKVLAGFAREDLFTCVHEQFMTETAVMADIVLPATMFLEHDDIYQAGGHQHILMGPKIVEAPGECRSNHEVLQGLASRLGAEHPGFDMTAWELCDWTLKASGYPDAASLKEQRWQDCQPDFSTAHYRDGFAHSDGKFHFAADWAALNETDFGADAGPEAMPSLPDHWQVIEEATAAMPFRLATSPARNYLNSSFNETPTSIKNEGRPAVKLHSLDAADLAVAAGDLVRLGNDRGEVLIHAEIFDGQRRGVVIVEGIWPNQAFVGGIGINALTAADKISPIGGGPFHDNRIWIRREDVAEAAE
jgi:anaerobic selenocysteine-containing dehydrogenase